MSSHQRCWTAVQWYVIDKFFLIIFIFYLCIDIDECSSGQANCSQMCNNTVGSYVCLCNDSYTLDLDQHTCIGKKINTSQTYTFLCSTQSDLGLLAFALCCIVDFGSCLLVCPGSSVGRALCL